MRWSIESDKIGTKSRNFNINKKLALGSESNSAVTKII